MTLAKPDENLIDDWVRSLFGKLQPFKPTDETRHFWIPVIEKVILNLSDQQLLTGLSILIAGFATHCSISVYHFAIVSDLAWFSANVHLSSLIVLQQYLLREKAIRNWRVVLMSCMGILLLANNAMQGHWAWYESWSFDAQCVFDDLVGNWGGEPGYWAEVNIGIIGVFYPLQILLLFDTTLKFLRKWLWIRPMKCMDKAIRTSNELVSSSKSTLMKLRYQGQSFLCEIARAVYIIVAAIWCSSTLSIILDLFWFGYGIWGLQGDRTSVADQMDGSENSFTFGQIMPLLLLSSTIFVFKETYEGDIPALEPLSQ